MVEGKQSLYSTPAKWNRCDISPVNTNREWQANKAKYGWVFMAMTAQINNVKRDIS